MPNGNLFTERVISMNNGERDLKLDSLIMLLSTDWFSGHWHTIGIHVNADEECTIREGCREIVKQILSGAREYWLASFSRERSEQTYSMLQEVLQRSGVTRSNLNRINRLVGEDAGHTVDSATQSLLISLTGTLLADLASSTTPKVDPSTRERLVKIWDQWNQTSINAIDFDERCLNSESRWDRHLRGVTPDLPTMLSDYVSAIIEEQDNFDILWSLITNDLSARQKDELLGWYRSAAQ